MTRFADPFRCPSCGGYLEDRPVQCPGCGLPLRGELPRQLFGTLHQADVLLAQLQSTAGRSSPLSAAQMSAPQMSAAQLPAAQPSATQPYPLPHSAVPASPGQPTSRPLSGLSSATVPKILLGLGALCLVVAALTFLAVTWSDLGMAWRTAILWALAGTAFAGAQVFTRKSLPAATESFTVIGLAFAGLGLAGAANAGWLPPLDTANFTVVLGVLFAALGLATSEAARRPPGKVLYTGEIALGFGAALVTIGSAITLSHHYELVLLTCVLVAAGVAAVSRRALDQLRRVLFVVLAAITWLVLAITGLARAILHASLNELWADGHLWPLLAAAAVAAAPAAIGKWPHAVRVAAAAVAASLTWIAPWLPITTMTSATAAIAVAIAPLLLASAATYFAPPRWRIVAAVPLGLSAVVPAVAFIALCALAIGRFETNTPWTATFGALLPTSGAPFSALLMVPLAMALLTGAVALARLFTDPLPLLARHAVPLVAALALVGTATIAHDPVPIALIVGLILLIGVAVAAWSLRSGREPWLSLAAAILALALWTAATGNWFTAITITVIAALAATLTLPHQREALRTTGNAVLPLALSAALWAYADIAGLVPGARALIALVTLGALAILRPRIAGEVSTAAAAFLAITVATTTAPTSQSALTWLAVNLTVGGALVAVHSQVSADRGHLRWLAAALLLVASWVRLGQLGVNTPEAYTLPAALVLLAAGLLALRRDPGERTHRALAPGLLLGLTPSLLWALADPISLRSLLLGLACAALVLAGAALSWNAPLVYGAAAGVLLLLREATPWAAQINPWIVTGTLGLILTAVGITWEQRVIEIQRSRAYLARLR